jgi:hypothetical protein
VLSLEGTKWFQVLNGVRQYTNELQHLCRVTQLVLGVVGIHVNWMADFWSGLESLTLQHQGGSILSALLSVFLAGSTGFNLTHMACTHHIVE